DLASGLAGGQGGQALGGPIERQHRGDVDGEGAGGGLLGQRRDDLADRSGHDVAAGQAGGDQGVLGGGVGGAGHPAAFAHRLDGGGVRGVGDELDQGVAPGRVGVEALLGDRPGGVVDHGGGAQHDEPVGVGGRAGGHHGGAPGREQLHGVGADAAAGAVDQDD